MRRWAPGPPDPYAPPASGRPRADWLRRRWPFLAGLAAGLALGAGAAVWAARRFMGGTGFGDDGPGFGYGYGYGPMLFGPFQVLGAVLLAVLGITAVAYVATGLRLRHRDDALRILRSRYARGEIALEEYRSMSEHLRRG